MSYAVIEENDVFAFLGRDGVVGDLIRGFDWSSTPLGKVERWCSPLKIATSLLLQSPVPMVMLWGEQGVMIYNDAYSIFAGHRHPAILGSNVREGWPEVADFNDNVMRVGFAGNTLAYRNQELTLHRKGYPEQVWMDLDYFPVLNEFGKPAGVMAIVVETTDRVLAERRNNEEFQRLQSLFSQAPTFMAMLGGPEHRFDLVNPEYRKLIGNRDVEGRVLAEALPEVIGQGFLGLLDQVLQTGEPVKRTAERVLLRWQDHGPLEERFVDFVYQPIRDDAGTVRHIFVQGSDVTERVRAENHQKLLINELNHRVKNTLTSIQSIVTQALRGSQTKEEASKAISARILALSRAHDVLTRENWDGADLHTMVEKALDAFQHAGRTAIHIAGPKLRVGPHAALSMALAVHELATNAAKYGALSGAEGLVDVRWAIGNEKEFSFTWTETGGPPVVQNERQGFGTRLILRVLPVELQGTAKIDYRESGVVFSLTTTLDAISDKPVAAGG